MGKTRVVEHIRRGGPDGGHHGTVKPTAASSGNFVPVEASAVNGARTRLAMNGDQTRSALTQRGARDSSHPATPVLIASAVGALRERWGQGIRGTFVVHEAAERDALAQSLVSEPPPGVVVLDLGFPDPTGIEGVAQVRHLRPAARVVALTRRLDEREGLAVLKAGAVGYADRRISPVLLAKALTVVQDGEVWISRALVATLLEELSALNEPRLSNANGALTRGRWLRLTVREREIAALVGAGAMNKEIAERVGISERTVKAHLSTTFRKLGVSDRLQLALFVLHQS